MSNTIRFYSTKLGVSFFIGHEIHPDQFINTASLPAQGDKCRGRAQEVTRTEREAIPKKNKNISDVWIFIFIFAFVFFFKALQLLSFWNLAYYFISCFS